MVISTATVPPSWIAACGGLRRAGLKPGTTGYRTASCRQLAGHDLGEKARAFSPEVVMCRAQHAAQKIDQPSGQTVCATPLALGELEAFAGALLPVLLALLHARITREKTVGAKR